MLSGILIPDGLKKLHTKKDIFLLVVGQRALKITYGTDFESLRVQICDKDDICGWQR